ncbi:OmpA family protein [Pedobacter sp. MC2016-14]|uniref:OmpA family protein n=1 Tax=Pedobacter sp. MC2016-14 TaxID=2897327 RepID=UPI001E4A0F76|nr:OmpA family protein [Pedobacter sp. MC2016-14]MCD0487746.1 OmpA family protein [Pedobacter sp. MC2016-14]
MKILETNLLLVTIVLFAVSLQACKTKKVATKPATAVVTPAPVEEKAPVPPPAPAEEKPAPVVEKPDFNFSNVQFEFNSDVLKTASFSILDEAVRELKKDPSAKFTLNGHSSIEGSAAHNMSLSVDRANAVKSYLVNAGIPAANLAIKGYGATVPIATNDNEAGRALNRRVELKAN